jgi:hypothetical protein
MKVFCFLDVGVATHSPQADVAWQYRYLAFLHDKGRYATSIGIGRTHRMAQKNTEILILTPFGPARPALAATAGAKTSRRFVEFFTANIRNKNTREAYRRNITAFLAWFDAEAGMALDMIEPMVVAAYVVNYSKTDYRNQPSNST